MSSTTNLIRHGTTFKVKITNSRKFNTSHSKYRNIFIKQNQSRHVSRRETIMVQNGTAYYCVEIKSD